MELRYMGFEQKANLRAYRFERLMKGEPIERHVVTADIGLFLIHRISIQDGPTLCANKLAADLERLSQTIHELTAEDCKAHADARLLAETRKAESKGGGRTAHPA
jgi:hypothetical protein